MLRRRVRLVRNRCRDLLSPTFTAAGSPPQLSDLSFKVTPSAAVPDEVVSHYMGHRFDLLGSGWVEVRHGMSCRGLHGKRHEAAGGRPPAEPGQGPDGVNRANHAEAARRRRLLDEDYQPIDWQLDFKSGYRWSNRRWYRLVKTAPVPGADIKVPWELARMQHLPQLALAYCAPGSGWYEDDRIPAEFRHQVLDFAATNPPRFGANWKCTMDVGIRAANWILTHALLRGSGVAFDDAFTAVFASSVREHGRHIAGNLEWAGGHRANHYLGNIAGLVFCGAALASDPETDAWLALGLQELIAEGDHQFLPDGGHFEGATAYHRFCMEMMLFPAALLLGLDRERVESLRRLHGASVGGRAVRSTPAEGQAEGDEDAGVFPAWWWQRIRQAHRLLSAVTDPAGDLVQIGDNDSGMLFNLSPAFRQLEVDEARRRYLHLEDYTALPDGAPYFMDERLETDGTMAAAEAFLGMGGDRAHPKGEVIQALMGSSGMGVRVAPSAAGGGRPSEPARPVAPAPTTPPTRSRTFRAARPGLRRGLIVSSFPDFGCFVFRSPRLYVAIRCLLQRPLYTAHLHNDQLSVTLWLDGEELIVDPGTYLYTPFPEERNRYRSARTHDCPWQNGRGEPASLDQGVFRLPGFEPATVRLTPTEFLGSYRAAGTTAARRVRIEDDGVVIEDWGRAGDAESRVPYSPGYGLQERRWV